MLERHNLANRDSFRLLLEHVQLRQLRQLAAIVDAGSINAAAKRLAIAQPALSRSIRALEQSLGERLIERTGRGVTATPLGTAFVRHYTDIEAAMHRAASDLDAVRGVAPTIRIGVGPVEAADGAAIAIDRFRRRFPRANIVIREGSYPALEPALRAGQLDLVIGIVPFEPAPRSEAKGRLRFEFLAELRATVVVRAGHPLARSRAVSIRELQAAQWVVPAENTIAAEAFEEAFRARGLTPPTSTVAAPIASATIAGLVVHDDLVAIVPEQLVRFDLGRGVLRALVLTEPVFTAPIYVATLAGEQRSSEMLALLREVRRAFGAGGQAS